MSFIKTGIIIGCLYCIINFFILINKYYLNTYQYGKDYCLVSKNESGCYIYSLMDEENLCLTLYHEPRDCNSYYENQIVECWRFQWNFQAPKCVLYFFENDVKEDIKQIDKVFYRNFEKNVFNIGICLLVLTIYRLFKKKEPSVFVYVPEEYLEKNKRMFEFNGKYYQIRNNKIKIQ